MKFRGILFAASLLAAFLVGSAFSQDQKVEAELTSLIRKLVAAQTAFDAPAMEQILSADYIEVSPVGEVDDRARVLGFYSPAAKAASGESPAVQLDEFKVRTYKDHASVIVRESFQRKNGRAGPHHRHARLVSLPQGTGPLGDCRRAIHGHSSFAE